MPYAPELPLHLLHLPTVWSMLTRAGIYIYVEENPTCSLAKRKTALSRRRKSPCPEVHLAQQLDAMSLTLPAPVMVASSEDEVEELDVEGTLLLAVAGRRAGIEDTDTNASTGADLPRVDHSNPLRLNHEV